jgi:hypothetical protein
VTEGRGIFRLNRCGGLFVIATPARLLQAFTSDCPVSLGNSRPSTKHTEIEVIKFQLVFSAFAVTAATTPLHADIAFIRGYTNTSTNKHTTLYWWNNVQAQASAATSSTLGALNFTADAYVADYYFTDGTNYYRTSQTSSGINEIRFFGSSLTNLLANNHIASYSLSQTYSSNDDFWADSEGNFYRNNSNNGSGSVVKYTSLANLLSGNGTGFNYGVNYGYDDAFWSYGGKFYRTNTNNGDILGIAEYASFQALINRQVTTTYNGSGSAKDMLMTIPAPGAIALVGLAGLVSRRRR